MASNATESFGEASQVEEFHREVRDAKLLLDYAVETGRAIENRLVAAMKRAEQFLLEAILPPPEERSTFEQSYRDLAQAMAPVSAATLQATSDRYGRRAWPLAPRERSEAKIWSRKLWLLTSLFAVAVVFAENYDEILTQFYARDEDTDDAFLFWYKVQIVLQSIVPFAYGGLGAATYLLRSAHEHLYTRTFDPNRMPEYYNRILLGLIAGGAIQLFVTQVADDGGELIRISAAALAFIAGYNCDFLFSAIERVSAAILPKAGLASVQRAEQVRITGLSLNELVEQLDKATTPEAKEAIQGLINKIKERL